MEQGKTTLLNILAGKENYDSGNIVFRNNLRVGYLEQSPPIRQNSQLYKPVSSPTMTLFV